MDKLVYDMEKTVKSSDDLILWIYQRRRVPVVFAEMGIRGLLCTSPRPLLEIVFVESGTFRLHVGTRFADIGPGSMVWINAHYGNRAEMKQRAVYSCISLDVANEPAFRDFAAGPWLQAVDYTDRATLRQAFAEVTRWHHATRHPLREPLLTAALLRLLSTITASGEAPADAAMPAALNRCLRFLESRQEDPDLDMRAVASAASVSESSLRRLFLKHIQTTPTAYLTSLRLHRAHDLLHRTTLSVKEITTRVGYADPLYFSRVFRIHHGKSPAATRLRLSSRMTATRSGP